MTQKNPLMMARCCAWRRTILIAVAIFTEPVFAPITPIQETLLCFGDALLYNCSVASLSSIELMLEVAVRLPGLMRSIQTYTNTKLLNRPVSLFSNSDPRVTVTLRALDIGRVPKYAEAVIEITPQQLDTPINGSLLECSFGQRRDSLEVFVNQLQVPLTPVGLVLSDERMEANSVEASLSIQLNPMPVPKGIVGAVERIKVLLEWVAPSLTKPGSVLRSTIFSKNRYNLTHYPLNVTLNYNVEYTATVVAINCAGESQPLILSSILYANCGVPSLPLNARRNYSRTNEGAIVTFICDRYFLPTVERSSMCLRSGVWHPPPESHICIFDDRRTVPIDTTRARLFAATLPLLGFIFLVVLFVHIVGTEILGQRLLECVMPEAHSPIQESHHGEWTDEEVDVYLENMAANEIPYIFPYSSTATKSRGRKSRVRESSAATFKEVDFHDNYDTAGADETEDNFEEVSSDEYEEETTEFTGTETSGIRAHAILSNGCKLYNSCPPNGGGGILLNQN